MLIHYRSIAQFVFQTLAQAAILAFILDYILNYRLRAKRVRKAYHSTTESRKSELLDDARTIVETLVSSRRICTHRNLRTRFLR